MSQERHLHIVKDESAPFPVVVDRVAQAQRDGGTTFSLIEYKDDAPADADTAASKKPRGHVRELLVGGAAVLLASGAFAAHALKGDRDSGPNVIAPAASTTLTPPYDDGTNYINGRFYRHTVHEGDTVEGIAKELAAHATGSNAVSAEDLQPHLKDYAVKGDGLVQNTGDGTLQIGEHVEGFVPTSEK